MSDAVSDAAPSAFALLAPLATRGMVLDLASMRTALAGMGDPHLAIPCVHIAGTNGKGSVTAMVDAVLRASGLRSAAYTSPHLHRFVERFRIDGEPSAEADAAGCAQEVRTAIDHGAIPPLTFFEAATLVAWMLFRRANVDIAVMEVGLGGRLDATTLCAPRVTAITRIAMDHTAILGNSIAEIAREKAGILKPGVPCVLGPDLRHGEARRVIEAQARTVGAELFNAPDVTAHADGSVRVFDGSATWHVTPALRGHHQLGNVAVTVGVCAALAQQGWPITPVSMARGIESVRWPARLESIGDVLLDAAHNPDGVAALVSSLPALLGNRRVGALIFGASRDKAWREMLDLLLPWVPAERRFFGAADVARAVPPDELAAYGNGVTVTDADSALRLARAVLGANELALVCGSIYFVAGVRAAVFGLIEDPRIAL